MIWTSGMRLMSFVWAVPRPAYDNAKRSFTGHLVVATPDHEIEGSREAPLCGYRPRKGWTQYQVALHRCRRCAKIARRLEGETMPPQRLAEPIIAPLDIPRNIFA